MSSRFCRRLWRAPSPAAAFPAGALRELRALETLFATATFFATLRDAFLGVLRAALVGLRCAFFMPHYPSRKLLLDSASHQFQVVCKHKVRARVLVTGSYLIASALGGEAMPPSRLSGAEVSMNSVTPSSAQSSASSSRLNISPSGKPIRNSARWCRMPLPSIGVGSTPGQSEPIAAIRLSHSHSISSALR